MCKPESLCCTVDIGTTLQINCSSIKKKKAKPLLQWLRASLGRQCDPPPCSLAAGGRGRGPWRLWVQIASLTLSVRCAFAGASGTCLVSSDSAQTEKGAPSALTWG